MELFGKNRLGKIVNDIMQSEYQYGDLKGYMEWKKFLGFLEKQDIVTSADLYGGWQPARHGFVFCFE